MGYYLNPNNKGFKESVNAEIYIDKTGLIALTNKCVNTEQKYICVSRPRRFGKSMTLKMLAAYYSRGCDSKEIFRGLEIENEPRFKEHLNKYDVIYLDMSKILIEAEQGKILQYLTEEVWKELRKEYGQFLSEGATRFVASLRNIYLETGQEFIFLIDEWDCIMRERQKSEELQRQYLDFLRDLLKDQPYVALAYMTGILPIKKYGIHSALNMFTEYSMTNQKNFEEYTGFTEDEVKTLCGKYHMEFSEAKSWYDGYTLRSIKHVYNPKSVVEAMRFSCFDNYWTSTETYEALKIYIDMDFDGLQEDILLMLGGGSVKVDPTGFQNDMKNLVSKDDVLTLLIHLGYLAYHAESSEVSIPNKEILYEFRNAVRDKKWGRLREILYASDELLKATIGGEEKSVAAAIDKAQTDVSSILTYNNEANLAAAVRLAYYTAVCDYAIIRELPAGIGYADVVFIPQMVGKPAIVVELKYNRSAKTAIKQIKENRYPEVFEHFSGEIILVGINYSKKTKKHTCKIEKINK